MGGNQSNQYRRSLKEIQMRKIIDHALDAIITIDHESKILEWNKQAEEIFGWTCDEAVGENMAGMIIPPEYRKRHYAGMEKFLSDGSAGILNNRIEIEGLHKNGKVFPVELSVTEYKVHGEYLFTAFIRDITARKKSEKRLMEYMDSLKQSNQELDDFVYIVSHDLKEPLRGLYGYSQFLAEDYGDQLDNEGLEMLENLKKLSHRMEELIDTLLYYSRLGRSDLAFDKTNLKDVLDKTLDLVKSYANEHDAVIKVKGTLPEVYCDKARVGEIFNNLIVNAIKYNESEKKYVEIGCITDHRDFPGQNVIYVADNGIGIDESKHDVIFKMFKRLHGRREYGGGTGSGLAFVKKIIDRHDGKIWVESNKGNGSVFYFTLQPSK